VGARFFAHVQTGPGPTQSPVQWVPGSSRGKIGRGVVLTTHPLLVPRSRMSRAIPLFHLWAFGACYRAKFTFLYLRDAKYSSTIILSLHRPAVGGVTALLLLLLLLHPYL
jgi:hypothetical protein